MYAHFSRPLIVVMSTGLLLANGPASARGFGSHTVAAPHTVMGSRSAGGATIGPSSGSWPGKGTGHHPGKPSGGSTGASASSSSSAGVVIQQSTSTTTSSAAPVTADMTRNPSLTGGTDPAIGQPSPRVPDVVASGGGTATIDHSGGSGNTLADCMRLWDFASHMSKAEWRTTCERTLNGIDLPTELGGPAPAHPHIRHAKAHTQVAQ